MTEVTHEDSGQTDASKPHYHCRFSKRSNHLRLMEDGKAFLESLDLSEFVDGCADL